jgi:hypothetical protein
MRQLTQMVAFSSFREQAKMPGLRFLTLKLLALNTLGPRINP